MKVAEVIERLRANGNAGRAWFHAYRNPQPLTAAQIAVVRAPDDSVPVKELREWLAYDATWLPLLEAGDTTRLAAKPLRSLLEARALATRRPKSMSSEALTEAWLGLLPEAELANALVIELPMSGSQEHFLVVRPGRFARVLGFHNQSEFWWKYKTSGAFLAHYFCFADDAFDTEQSTFRVITNGQLGALPESTADRGFAHLDDGPSSGVVALVTPPLDGPSSSGVVALVTPPLDVTGALSVSYRTRHSFVMDASATTPVSGARVEISADGIHFVDVTTLGVDPGYAGALAATNPLGAGQALVAMSAGFPAFATRTLALGTGFVGFVRRSPEAPSAVCNRAPLADAGHDQSVRERSGDPMTGPLSVVTLSAAGSSDPESETITYARTQLTQPTVTLTGASSAAPTFTVPDVPDDTVLAFRVTVSDGTSSSFDDVYVTVRHDNIAPVASLTGLASVESGAMSVVLDGEGSSDPDGDVLSYTFTRVAGPTVTLAVVDDVATFTAPTVTATTTLVFLLVVSDGIDASAAAAHTITVIPPVVEEPDAGVEDSGVEPTEDSGVGPNGDAAMEPTDDGGVEPTDDGGTGSSSGGGCATSHGSTSHAWFVIASLALVVGRRRRVR